MKHPFLPNGNAKLCLVKSGGLATLYPCSQGPGDGLEIPTLPFPQGGGFRAQAFCFRINWLP